ncbi:MAG TPA: DUF3772 domain-containing protein [Caulobacteraceae bacterium]|jgi:small-conductance mechanosensitive channel|nr:DUF3772 domain-containing protein [Caulobacteraceae bacterium]
MRLANPVVAFAWAFALLLPGLAHADAAAANTAAPPVVVSPPPVTAPAAAAPALILAPDAAKPPTPPPTFAQTVEADQTALAQLAQQVAINSNDDRLAAMGARAAAINAGMRSRIASMALQVAGIDKALAKLVPARRKTLSEADQAKRSALLAQRIALGGQIGQAQAISAQAENVYDAIAERRRAGFSARVLTRTDSPLSPDFWTSLAAAANQDGDRLGSLLEDAVTTPFRAPEPRGLLGLIAGLLFGVAMVLPGRRWLERFGRRKSGESVHPGFARTGAALWVALVDIATPTLAMAGVRLGAQWGGLLSPEANRLVGAGVFAVAWAAVIVALGRVLATEKDASQRLLPLPDDTAARVRLPLVIVAVVSAGGLLLTRLNYIAGASVAATIAANCAISLAYAAVAGLILVSFGRGESAQAQTAESADPRAERLRAPAWTLISLVLAGAIVVTVGAVLAGYTTLAAVTSGQIFWLSIIAAAAYLAMRFADDLTTVTFSPHGWASRTLYLLFNFHRSTIGQAGVLVSAALQLLILVGAIGLALTPFGSSGDLLTSHLDELAAPLKLGSVTISPAAVAAGLVTLIVGIAAARAVQRWTVRRYLPVTDWDSGLRNSVTTGVGYLGVLVAVLCALAASGLGFSQIALIASALSVGIGFGLQQVVQNFVSGVILLVERPVKVGDWINIGGVEGDIRRIRVRATEIETSDRTMVIVPNSDLITKSVQNKTLGERCTLVELQLSITRPDRVREARELILGIAQGAKGLARSPAPQIHIQSLGAAGAVNLACLFYIEDPREAARLRSDCYFEVMDALRAHEIEFAGAV